MYILKRTSHILPRSLQPSVKPTAEDPAFANGKGLPWGQQGRAGRACAGSSEGLWRAQAGPAGRAQQGRGAQGASDTEIDFHVDVGTHTPAFPSGQSTVRVVSLQWQGEAVFGS